MIRGMIQTRRDASCLPPGTPVSTAAARNGRRDREVDPAGQDAQRLAEADKSDERGADQDQMRVWL